MKVSLVTLSWALGYALTAWKDSPGVFDSSEARLFQDWLHYVQVGEPGYVRLVLHNGQEFDITIRERTVSIKERECEDRGILATLRAFVSGLRRKASLVGVSPILLD